MISLSGFLIAIIPLSCVTVRGSLCVNVVGILAIVAKSEIVIEMSGIEKVSVLNGLHGSRQVLPSLTGLAVSTSDKPSLLFLLPTVYHSLPRFSIYVFCAANLPRS